MKKPTLKEVKEHFKNAEFVKCAFDGKKEYYNDADEIDFDTISHEIWSGNSLCLWSEKNGYGKILTYETNKMKKYEITEEQIKEAHNYACPDWKQKIEDWFPQAFETKLEVGKWYKKEVNYGDLGYELAFPTDLKTDEGYGFNTNSIWNKNTYWGFYEFHRWKPATDKEVEEALIHYLDKQLAY